MKKFFCAICLVFLALALSACGANNAAINAIKGRGALRVGVKMDVPNFGYLNPKTSMFEGLEIDLAKLIAKEIFGNEEAVKLVGVTTQTRESMLENGEVDMIIATFTITEERKKNFHFTTPYFHDAIGFMTLKDAGMASMQDMDGKTIGIAQFGTAYDALVARAKELNISVNYQKFASYPEIIYPLKAGTIDVFCVDKSILMGYVDEDTVILDDSFNPQEYGIAVKRDNDALVKYLDELMAKIQKDGRMEEILNRWRK